MANIQIINVSQPNDGLGDSLRQSQVKANANFSELNSKKVEAEAGKGLSANDFTTTLKQKVDGIESGAKANVQSDWLQSNPNSDDFIKNKPIEQFVTATGYVDYANSSVAQNAVAGIELKLTNDKLGAGTVLDKMPFGVSNLFNSTTNQFDFSQLNVGDWVNFRPDLLIDLVGTNTSFSLYMKMAIGSGQEWILPIHNGERKSTNAFSEVPFTGFYIGSNTVKNFPAELYIITDANATVKVNGFLLKIERTNLNIVNIQASVDNNRITFIPATPYSFNSTTKVLTMTAGWEATINDLNLITQTQTLTPIQSASIGFKRIDLIVLNTSGVFNLLQGLESESVPIKPVLPVNTVEAFFITIFGEEINLEPQTTPLASNSISGTVKTDITETDPVVYTKTTVDDLLENKADLINGKVPASQLPSYVDDVIECYAQENSSNVLELFSDEQFSILIVPEFSKIYIDLLTNMQYRWGGTIYVELGGGGGGYVPYDDYFAFPLVGADGIIYKDKSTNSYFVWDDIAQTYIVFNNVFIVEYGNALFASTIYGIGGEFYSGDNLAIKAGIVNNTTNIAEFYNYYDTFTEYLRFAITNAGGIIAKGIYDTTGLVGYDKVLVINSDGEIGSEDKKGPVIDYQVVGGELYKSCVIPFGVTNIRDSSFANNQLEILTIPNSVTTIGNFAFESNLLTSVTIPNSVTNIGAYTFQFNLLTSVTIPNTITIIATSLFENNQLTSVTIPNSVTSIENGAFSFNQLTSVTIPNSVTIIENGAFRNNQLTSVTIPNSLTIIPPNAFSFNQLTSVTIPNSVTSIENFAFESNLLTSVTIPNSVTTIGDYAFQSNLLTSVTLPPTCTYYETSFDSGVTITGGILI